MLHADRTWVLHEVESAAVLAEKLTSMTWCCCQAFTIAGYTQYVWVNDATSPDGIQEYGLVKLRQMKGYGTQLDSVTFGWLNERRALELIEQSVNGEFDQSDWACEVKLTLQTPEEHGTCIHCA